MTDILPTDAFIYLIRVSRTMRRSSSFVFWQETEH